MISHIKSHQKLISTPANCVYKLDSHLSPAPGNHIANTSGNFNILNAYPASQIPITTLPAKQNTTHCKQSFQNRNEFSAATREAQFTQSKFPPSRRHSTNVSNIHHPKIKSVLFALFHLRNQLPTSYSNISFQSKHTLETNCINKNKYSMPSKTRITRVRFTDASLTANQPSTPPTTPGTADQRSNSPSNSRAASFTQIITPLSPAKSSNVSTPLTPSQQIPTFDQILNKLFSKSLIASLTSKDAVFKEVRDRTLTNNENRLKTLNPYIHSYSRDLHVLSGCVCVDEKVAIPNVFREALIDDIRISHPGTWGMICMATYCWWPYMNRELIVKATECAHCTVIGKNLKSVIPAKQLRPHVPCVEPNQEFQIDFGGQIFHEKDNDNFLSRY